jgi:anti-anti-sigma factor
VSVLRRPPCPICPKRTACSSRTPDRGHGWFGGELDVGTVGPFADHLALLVDASTGDVDVDMALVSFCDAATLRVLVTVHQQLRERDRRLRVINASRPVMRLMQLTGLDMMLGAIGDVNRPARHPASKRASPRSAGPRKEGLDADRQAPERFDGGRHPPPGGHQRPTDVVVVGELNDWTPGTHPMTGATAGRTCTLTLPPGRRYRFRYLLDGQRWENDWDADDYVDNNYGRPRLGHRRAGPATWLNSGHTHLVAYRRFLDTVTRLATRVLGRAYRTPERSCWVRQERRFGRSLDGPARAWALRVITGTADTSDHLRVG